MTKFKNIFLLTTLLLSVYSADLQKLDVIGQGYDVYLGNPLSSTKQDPGIKRKIFDMTFNNQQRTHDEKWLIPDQVTENPL